MDVLFAIYYVVKKCKAIHVHDIGMYSMILLDCIFGICFIESTDRGILYLHQYQHINLYLHQ